MSQYGTYRDVDVDKKTVRQFARILEKNGIDAYCQTGGGAFGEVQSILGRSLCAYLASEPFVSHVTVTDAIHTKAPAFPACKITKMKLPKQITKARLSDVIYFAVDSKRFPLREDHPDPTSPNRVANGGILHPGDAYPRIVFEGGSHHLGYKMVYLLDEKRARKYIRDHIVSMNGSVNLNARDVDL